MGKKLPVGIQSFEKLIEQGFVYVDKTEYVYRLAHNNVPYFLSRPRRFGKSLLLSTMKAYFEGNRDFFKGLKIEKMEESAPEGWKAYPVFYFDFNGESYGSVSVEEVLEQHLIKWEKEYGLTPDGQTLGMRFELILETAYKKTGLRCVVLVDEYDKPLLEMKDDEAGTEEAKNIYKGFFSRLKKADEYIQFIFITGVTKYHKISIFSDLNQLRDISMDREYSGICGITEGELEEYFNDEIEDLADSQNMSVEKCREDLRRTYDGYMFHPEGTAVYNPYSLLGAFAAKDFGSYWFETGTPAFLIEKLKKSGFEVRRFSDKTLYASETTLKDYTGDSLDPVPLLYQTGYLTIKEYDRTKRRYTLCFPNAEVQYGFLESLMPSYVPASNTGNGLDIFTLDEYVEHGNLDGIRKVLTALFAGISYTKADDPFENYFQAVIYIVFKLLGKYVECEIHTFTGRIDCKVETEKYVYLFEFKRDDTEDAAIKQIDEKNYSLPFEADPRKLYKVGVSFDSGRRELVGWKVEE